MQPLRRLQSREITRSSSTPPWFAQNCRSKSRERDSESKDAPAGSRRTSGGRGGYVQGNSRGPSKRDKPTTQGSPSPSPSNPRGPTNRQAKDGSGDNTTVETESQRTPQLSTTDPECEIELPEDEDFVEGGVELSLNDHSFSPTPPSPTRPLLQLEERQLEEFWPSGVGLKALFLDYDGTLREFEAKPELAVPTPEIRELLSAIDAREDFVPHIISGRNASFLEAHFGDFPRFTLVAEHGFQIWRPDSRSWALVDGTTNHETWKSVIRSEMSNFVNEMPGSHLEEKASSLVWHYREVADAKKAEEKAVAVISRLGRLAEDGNLTDVRISHGHKIVEASYQKVRKGPVMRKLCEEKALFGEPYVGVLTAGDDVSDESMFDAAPSDYLTIKVGPAQTSARCRVDNPADLRAFLWKLVKRNVASQGNDEHAVVKTSTFP